MEISQDADKWLPHVTTSSTLDSEATRSGTINATSWLEGLPELSTGYPAISGFLKRTEDSRARKIVRDSHQKRYSRLPGRCVLLIFHTTSVKEKSFETPEALAEYLDTHPARSVHRLWILEDLELPWVEVLGSRLGVDPLVFSEQTNTFNFTDSQSIVTRTLPSLIKGPSSFTLRYFEFRQLKDVNSIQTYTNQGTFAINSRRIERWRDIDSPNFKCNWRHSFTRRCASFWTNQKPGLSGWDAVMLVDPAFDSFEWEKPHPNTPRACTILQDPQTHVQLKTLWASRGKDQSQPTRDTSGPYHGGSHTLSDTTLSLDDARSRSGILDQNRNLSSPLDEMVLHWTQVADPDLILSAREYSVNSAHYLLKYLANLWVHQLDLVQSTIAQSEYFSEDYQASVEMSTSAEEWRHKLKEVMAATIDMNHLRRQMLHFEHHLSLNLERLGIVFGAESINTRAPAAIQDAQKDFLHIHSRLKPFVARAMSLDKTASDLANLHASFKSIQYSELGLKLSIFASIVFPATLVSSMLSMGGEYLPGAQKFWVFWAITVPVVFLVAMSMVFSQYLKVWFLGIKRDWTTKEKIGKDL